MAVEGFAVDMNKPLVFQVGHLGEAYQEWSDQPTVSKKGHRLFANDFLESISRANYWFLALVWIPVACWFISEASAMLTSKTEVALLVILGLFILTAMEYLIHRFILHMYTRTYWTNTVHFLFGGHHHKSPMDGSRIVAPLYSTVPAAFPVYGLVRLVSTPATAPAIFGGMLIGYAVYELTHYYLHIGHPTNGVLKKLKRNHMNHHFGAPGMGFGVTSPFWDMVFGTSIAEKVGI